MSVVVDDQPLQIDQLGLKTVGQLLAHLQKKDRLVVHVLIDGKEPDLTKLSTLRSAPLLGHTLFIETTEPREIATDVLNSLEESLVDAEHLTTDAVKLLRSSQTSKALEKLRGCFSTWQHAHESVLKVAQLLRIDLSRITVEGRPFSQLLNDFAKQLRMIKESLENRDFVSLTDTLVYETSETSAQWRGAIASIRTVLGI
jgi:hypothetical protein